MPGSPMGEPPRPRPGRINYPSIKKPEDMRRDKEGEKWCLHKVRLREASRQQRHCYHGRTLQDCLQPRSSERLSKCGLEKLVAANQLFTVETGSKAVGIQSDPPHLGPRQVAASCGR